MDLLTGPALVGGIMIGMVMGLWSPERTRRDPDHAAAPEHPEAASPAALESEPVSSARCDGAYDRADSLGALHDEISAYRRAQRVLIAAGHDMPGVPLPPPAAGAELRYFKAIGAARGGADGAGCGGATKPDTDNPAAAPLTVHPSLPPSASTRV